MTDEELINHQLRELTKRVDKIEETQKEAMKMVNRYSGGIAFLVGAGLLVGWLFTFKNYFGR